MKKTLLYAAPLLLLAACGDENNVNNHDGEENNINNVEPENESEENEQAADSDDPLAAMEAHLEGEEGFDIGETSDRDYESIGAEQGYGLELDGEEIDLYLFEPDHDTLSDVEDSGMIDTEDGEQEAEVNGEIVLTGYEDHPEADRISTAFHTY
ncbi:hypothetical protein [Alkalicoccus chagannorensis]|uniref:hypothetical protein n=1 Tax=Alkalicoccus chagannorensis TaxID=427072 RepID=UPI00041965F0|nr:hypothetical protein [Alkalicoccus chagannorensis]